MMQEGKIPREAENSTENKSGLADEDAVITDSFRSAVRHTVDFTKSRGCPVARYDVRRKEAYLEYPDGSIVYHEKA